MKSCTLIISTYNWLPALELCLESCLQQSVLPGEIIIADDGSEKKVGDFIKSFAAGSAIPVHHVWQPDEGFQLARIRNKAIALAAGEYIIQIDGDLVLHPHFIKDHLKFRKKGFFTTGSRVILSMGSTSEFFKTKKFTKKRIGREDKNHFNRIRIPFLHNFLSRKYKIGGSKKYYVKGCNMAFWKEDLIKVNGYNEDFSGWGREDSEIAIRLINAGIRKRFLKFGAVCYHLFHQEACRGMEEKNVYMMNNAILKRITWAGNGISQYNL